MLYRLLFQAAAGTLLTFGRDSRHLGGDLGLAPSDVLFIQPNYAYVGEAREPVTERNRPATGGAPQAARPAGAAEGPTVFNGAEAGLGRGWNDGPLEFPPEQVPKPGRCRPRQRHRR